MQAVILAAGQGKRLGKLTENVPKAMVKVNGKPMLQIILDQLKTVGVTEAILIVHYKKEQIQAYFGNEYQGMKLTYAFQEQMIGDGNAISYAEPHITEDKFLLIACDNLFPTQHLRNVLKHDSDGVMSACIVDREKAKQLGVFLIEDQKISKIIEKSPEPPSTLANAYIHYMPKEAFEAIRKSTTPGVGGEYRFVDAVQIMINNGKKITYEPLTEWIDIGTEEQLQKAQELAKDLE